MKVYIIKQAKSPYKTEFFNELGKYIDLSIIYDYKKAYNRDDSWSSKKAKNHKEIFLRSFKFFGGYSISFGFNKYLNKDDSLIIVNDYSTLTGILSILYLKYKNIPFILNIDGGMIKKDNWIKYSIKKFLISSATYWLSPSKNSDKYLIHYGATEDKIYRYPFTSIKENDIVNYSSNFDEKKEIRNKLDINSYDKIILGVGKFIYRKGFDILLKAHKNNADDVALLIVGGSPIEEYKKIIKNNNLENVFFINFKKKDILADYFKAADLFILPTREDIWGLVINEAMAYGLPVITTENCVAGNELIDNGENGYIIQNENIEELSKKMKTILENPKLMNNMSKANIKKIDNYTIESMAKRHFEILKEIDTLKNVFKYR